LGYVTRETMRLFPQALEVRGLGWKDIPFA